MKNNDVAHRKYYLSKRKHIGECYNKLTIISDSVIKGKKYYVHAKCSCGNCIFREYDTIRSGRVKSCGCIKKDHQLEVAKSRVGEKFGQLTIVDIVDTQKGIRYMCKCSCGKTKLLRYSGDLVNKEYTSCGCSHPLIPGENHYRYDPNRKALVTRKKIRAFIYSCLRRVKANGKSSCLGYNCSQLKTHLEDQFTKNMSWDNYGTYWHIDHIIPIDYFIKTGELRPSIINSLQNLQPLTAKQNLQKANKLI